jgi:hypothetical protein
VVVEIAKVNEDEDEIDIILAVGWGVNGKKTFEGSVWRYYSVGQVVMEPRLGAPFNVVKAYTGERPITLEQFSTMVRSNRRAWATRLLQQVLG